MQIATETAPAGIVTGVPRLLLQGEGLALLVAAAVAYGQTGQAWWLFALLLLVPDAAMLGYLRGPRVGAIAYNAVHTTSVPLALAVAGWAWGLPVVTGLALIWLAHIGMDRVAGYGLKYGDAFRHTHLSGG